MPTVIDTNVLLSGLLCQGTPHRLIEQIDTGTLGLVSSPALLAELAEVIARPKFQAILVRSNTGPERMLAEPRRLAEIIDPAPLSALVSRDSDDDAVLALAVAAQADLIVSGNADLLVLGADTNCPWHRLVGGATSSCRPLGQAPGGRLRSAKVNVEGG